jgi:hypothetical protein
MVPAGERRRIGLHGASGALLSTAQLDGHWHPVPGGLLLHGRGGGSVALSRSARVLLPTGLEGRLPWRRVQRGALLPGVSGSPVPSAAYGDE